MKIVDLEEQMKKLFNEKEKYRNECSKLIADLTKMEGENYQIKSTSQG